MRGTAISMGMFSSLVRTHWPCSPMERVDAPAVATSSITDLWKTSGEMKTMQISYRNMRHKKKVASLSEGSRMVRTNRMHTAIESPSCTSHIQGSLR